MDLSTLVKKTDHRCMGLLLNSQLYSIDSFVCPYTSIRLPWWLSGKKSACQCRRLGFNPWVRKVSWRRKWQPTTVFLPGRSHGQRGLGAYSPWGHKRVWHHLATKWQQKNTSTTLFWLLYLCNKFWNQKVWVFQLFFQEYFGFWGCLAIPYECENWLF